MVTCTFISALPHERSGCRLSPNRADSSNLTLGLSVLWKPLHGSAGEAVNPFKVEPIRLDFFKGCRT